MARLAWFTPLPPISSGIARYSVEVLPHLTPAHAIDLFVEEPPGPSRSEGGAAVYSAHDFIWKQFRHPYDLIFYQLGNAPCHDYMWAYLVRYPGLVVLHDGQLHHARARWLLQQGRQDDYRSEFRFNHPDADVGLAELGIAGHLGSMTYLWPMLRTIVESARLVVVHNDWLATRIREEHPNARVEVITMGVPPGPVAGADANEAVRRRHGVPADAVLFTAFGKVTPEKRISQAIRALASIREGGYRAHLLLVGETVDHCDPHAEARALGVEDHVTAAGFVPDEAIADYLHAADVCLCMRWPSSRETSASWLRCLAAGRPTIVTDLVHTADIPALDPRTWTVIGASHAPSLEPACVSIDILDEDHSLWLAMRRLAGDARLRERLGRDARALWGERFTLDGMVADYRQIVETACELPLPESAARARLPAHLVPDGSELIKQLLGQMTLSHTDIAGIWLGDTMRAP